MAGSDRNPYPPMPAIGRSETWYARLARDAEANGDHYGHEAAKVAQYITLAVDPAIPWEEKLKYFKHTMRRHCQPPPEADELLWMFYHNLADEVRRHAGLEALRILSREDDLYAARVGLGQDRNKIEDEAELFFNRIMGSGEHRPDWFTEEDWSQMKLIREQWI